MPARLPSRLKVLKGTWRRDRSRPREPHPPLGFPPLWPGASVAERYWHRQLRAADRRSGQIATTADAVIVRLTIGALVEYQRGTDVIAKDGASYQAMTASGATLHRQRPEVQTAAEAWRRALVGLRELGLTPVARGRVVAGSPEEENALAAFKKKHRA